MTQDEISAFLAMGATEDDITELLRQQKRQEDIGDATRGKSYLTDTGRGAGGVPNIAGAISDMFVRGEAEKKAMKLGGDAANARAKGNETVRDYLRAAMGQGLGGVDLNKTASQADIAGSKPMPMPSMPQVGGAPPAGPMGPPGPQAGPPAPLPAPDPAQPPVAAPAPPPALGDAVPTKADFPKEGPGPAGSGGLMEMIANLLRKRGGGVPGGGNV